MAVKDRTARMLPARGETGSLHLARRGVFTKIALLAVVNPTYTCFREEARQARSGMSRLTRILILEDDLDFAELLIADLEDAGHECELATSGSVALSRLSEDTFDLLIADIHISKEGKPTQDGGLLLTGRLRNFPALQAGGRLVGLPIIAISGAIGRPGQSHILNAARSIGADAVLAKPFHSDEMRALIDQLLSERELRRS